MRLFIRPSFPKQEREMVHAERLGRHIGAVKKSLLLKIVPALLMLHMGRTYLSDLNLVMLHLFLPILMFV